MPSRDAGRLADVHLERNRVTRDDWPSFAPHRARVTEIITTAASPHEKPTLCLLGAGNGNDVDLQCLASHFDTITLVDFDGEALEQCVARQPAAVAAKITTVANVDLSGVLRLLAEAHQHSVSGPQLQHLIDTALHPTIDPQLGTYDVVASTCLLTQMIDSVASAIGANHPAFASVAIGVRDGHLELLRKLTRTGGTRILVTDFVSSDTLPELAGIPESQLELRLMQAVTSGNFFTGVNPAVLAQRMAEPADGLRARQIQTHLPWKWQLGNRVYAVVAMVCRGE